MLYNSIPGSRSVLISALIWATGLLWNRGLKPERDTQLPGAPSGCGTSTLLLPRPCHGPCGVSPDSPKATAASLGLVLAWQCKGRKKANINLMKAVFDSLLTCRKSATSHERAFRSLFCHLRQDHCPFASPLQSGLSKCSRKRKSCPTCW